MAEDTGSAFTARRRFAASSAHKRVRSSASAGLVMSGNTHVLPPGWAIRADHGIRWGDLVSCPLSFAQVLRVACLAHSLKDSRVSNRAMASA